MYNKMPKHYVISEVFNSSHISLWFDFYSNLNEHQIVNKLKEFSKSNINISYDTQEYSNGDLLIKEYDAEKSRYSLRLAYRDYNAIEYILEDICKWIDKNCYTSYDTGMKIYLTFNKELYTLTNIINIHKLNLISKIDETFIYDRFPNRKNSCYSISTKKSLPIKYFKSLIKFKDIDFDDNLYYNIDFSETYSNIIKYNFIGGEDYLSNIKNIKEVLEYLIIKTYQSINDYNDDEKIILINELNSKYNLYKLSYYDFDTFIDTFKKLKIGIDGNYSYEYVKIYWYNIRDTIFECILNSNLSEGNIQYLPAINKLKMHKVNLNNVNLTDIIFVNSNISGIFNKCSFVNTEVNYSVIYKSDSNVRSNINNSFLLNCVCNSGTTLYDSIVINDNELINCKTEKSLIKYAMAGPNLKLSENSVFIHYPLEPKSLDTSLKVDEIRDYNWIKSLNKNKNIK